MPSPAPTTSSSNDTINLYTDYDGPGFDGGGGTDTLNLLRGDASSDTLPSVTNFEQLNVESGTWSLAASENFPNGVHVFSTGTLISSDLRGTSAFVGGNSVTVDGGGHFGGTGEVGSVSISADGELLVGDSLSAGSELSISGSLSMAPGSHFTETLVGGAGSDVYVESPFFVPSTVQISGAQLSVNESGSTPNPHPSDVTLIANNSGTAVVGTFQGLPEGSVVTSSAGTQYHITYAGGTSGQDVVLVADIPTAPVIPAVTNNYLFETISPATAASLAASDQIIFGKAADTATSIQVMPYNGDLGSSGLTLSDGTTSVTFPSTISQVSAYGHLVFGDNSALLIGTNTSGDTLTGTSTATGPGGAIWGLGGDDHITAGQGADYIYGGLGADTITGGDGNYHIYGNTAGAPDATDGVDRITTGGGSSYINGNAGADIIAVGTSGSTGSNTVFGGADGDTITVHGAGSNHVNGNKGADTIDASTATGNNLLRGGADNDTIIAGQGQDVLLGDAGDDHLIAGTGATHLTVMTGGAGADLFDFSGGAQGVVAAAGSSYFQEVTDFTHGTDQIGVAFTVSTASLLTQDAGITFTTEGAAASYAQQLLSAHAGTGEVAAIQVGADTFLFYGATGGDTVDSVVKLDGVSASTLTASDFHTV